MAQPDRNRSPNPLENPPDSVVNPRVRRTALWLYVGPIVAFFVLAGIALFYWSTRPERSAEQAAEREVPRAEGTAGSTTPGGFEPQPAPRSTRDEIENRGGAVLTELGAALDEPGAVGRRIEVSEVEVERVDGPRLFWVRDGNVRVAVTAPANSPELRAGQRADIIGVVERRDGARHIRATRVSVHP